MSLRSKPLDERQLAVLRWVGDGCPDGPLAVPANKNRAQALANRGLVEVKRGKPGWRAVLTEAGRFYLDLGRYPEPPKPEPAETIDPPEGTGGRRPPGRPRNVPDQPGSVPDLATVRRIAQVDPGFRVPATVAKRLRLKTNVMYKQEVVVRFEVKITRVQDATRYVTATDQEAAAEKIREQLEKPYGLYANFETVGSEIEVVQKEENHLIKPIDLDREGPMLISLADAARATGISYSQLGDIAGKGSIEQVRVGSTVSEAKIAAGLHRTEHLPTLGLLRSSPQFGTPTTLGASCGCWAVLGPAPLRQAWCLSSSAAPLMKWRLGDLAPPLRSGQRSLGGSSGCGLRRRC